MTVEYLLVTFPEQRNVLADGAAVGVTNHILMLPGDEYQISLDGDGYAPASMDVELTGTSQVKPMVVAFSPATAAAPAPTTRGRIAAPAPAPAPAPVVAQAPAKTPAAKQAAAKKPAATRGRRKDV